MTLTSIAGEGLSAEIDALGAELHALHDAEGRDLLWNGDPAVWKGRAPVLFPIVGALHGGQYRLGGEAHHLSKHGFARTSLFELVEHTASSAVFRLASSEETLAVYPFDFELLMRFAIDGAVLTMTATVRNLDHQGPMLASFGFHPALRWPLPYGQPREAHALIFDEDEPAPIRRIDGDGLVLPQDFPTPVAGRELKLRDDLFTDDVVIFDRLASRGLTYGAPTGPRLRIDFAGSPYLGVWTKPGAGYVCIEPWHGMADPQGFIGDFAAKPGIFALQPGEARDCGMSISLQA